MNVDRAELERALRVWFRPGDVFEIRVLDATTRNYFRPHIESGYFDYEHIDSIAGALGHIISAKGCYATVNPVKPELLSRAVNRIRAAGREPTTADGDIVCRRWLLIDCDAKRASGIPSSDAEHDLARAKAIEIRDGFASMGWPAPVEVDSGNGAQLMYRVDLPSADGELIHSVLKSVAAVSSDAVDIDITVHNPARIWRLPGTMNCKGDSTDLRPHRMARIIVVPQSLEVVSEEMLRSACSVSAEPEVRHVSVPAVSYHEKFDLESWISKHCVNVSGPMPWKDGRKWVFDVCPFNSDHTNRSAVITQLSNGAISFTCHHNGCKGNDWSKLRDMLDPGHETVSQSVLCPEVDMSEFLDKISEKKSKRENPFDDPGDFPADLLSVPGIVDDVIALDLKTAPYPNRVLAFAGAIALMSFLLGRKIHDKRDVYTNLYMIALADSGTGKDHPRKVNIALLRSVGALGGIADSFASGAGLEDSMYSCPVQLFQMDEIDWLFNTLKGAKDASISESINDKLLKFYSSSSSIYPLRKKAVDRGNANAEKLNQAHICNPSLTLFGTAVPDYFYESLSRRVLENGLVARCLILEAGIRGKHGSPSSIDKHISDDLRDRIKFLVELPQNEDMLGNPDALEMPETEAAGELCEKCLEICEGFYNTFAKINEKGAMALWNRAMEKVHKLAMIYAFSVSPLKPCVDTTAVQWAFDFVSFCTRKMLYRSGQFCYESEFDKLRKKFLKLITDGVTGRSQILQRLGISKKQMDELEATMLDAEKIEIANTRPRVYKVK